MSDSNDIDWKGCPEVESVPGRCGGAWVVKDSRILSRESWSSYDGGLSPEEIGEEVFDGLGAERARRIIAFARSRIPVPAQHS